MNAKLSDLLLPSLSSAVVARAGGQKSSAEGFAEGAVVSIDKSVLKDRINGGRAG